jgi:hypothetical protein
MLMMLNFHLFCLKRGEIYFFAWKTNFVPERERENHVIIFHCELAASAIRCKQKSSMMKIETMENDFCG